MGAANVEAAPVSVAFAPLELLVADEPPELELELLLAPHAAAISDAATTMATAPMRRFLKVISLARSGVRVCVEPDDQVLSSCEPVVFGLFALGRQSVAEAEMRVDEAPPRERFSELHAQLSHVHVDRPFTRSKLSAPHEAEQLLAGHDPIRAACQLGEEPKLSDRQHQRPTPGARQVLLGWISKGPTSSTSRSDRAMA